eukprot:792510_1
MSEGFDVTQTQSKLWTPLHIRSTKSYANVTPNQTACSPEQTCDIYESVLQTVNRDTKRIKEMIDNIEIEQKCLKQLLRQEPHWMGLVNGIQRKLMHCSINLEITLSTLQQNRENRLNTDHGNEIQS